MSPSAQKAFTPTDGPPRSCCATSVSARRAARSSPCSAGPAPARARCCASHSASIATSSGQVTRPEGRIGVVFQEPRLLPWLTAAENLRLVVTEGVPEPNIRTLLAAVGIPEAGALHPAALSLGMARRVAVARALAVDPAMLVLDEPFVSLDRRLGTLLGTLLTTRARRQCTLVLVAMHDLEHALAMADRDLWCCMAIPPSWPPT